MSNPNPSAIQPSSQNKKKERAPRKWKQKEEPQLKQSTSLLITQSAEAKLSTTKGGGGVGNRK